MKQSIHTDQNISIHNLHKGLTNQNYILRIDDASFIVRIPHQDQANIVNRHNEFLALQALKDTDIDVRTIYYDEKSGYKITSYVEDAYDFDAYPGADKLVRVAQLMKKFHSLQKHIHVRFDPVERYQSYRSHVSMFLYDVAAYEPIVAQAATMQFESVLCHNDWVAGNILFTKQHTYLIDYEYASDNDPLFDVMSFLSENKIVDPSQRELFYTYYFDGITDALRNRLQIWESYHNLLWCMWAMMMWEHRHDDVYRSIAKDKYEALTTRPITLR